MGIRHLITKYEEGGRAWAEAWVQVDFLGRCWCLWRRRIPLDAPIDGHINHIPSRGA